MYDAVPIPLEFGPHGAGRAGLFPALCVFGTERELGELHLLTLVKKLLHI
jgi:hypothetical protein